MTHTYRYDSSGARVHRTSSGPDGLSSQTDFETAGGRFTKEVGEKGTASWRLTVLGGNGPLVEVHIAAGDENPQDKRFLHNDHLASRTLETNATGGVIAEHRTTPFGQRLDASGAPIGFGNPMMTGFGGHDHEASGFIDMGGRHYDPSIGRFLSVDPLNVHPLNPQSANGYAYVMNDPMTLTDPTGFGPCNGDFCTSLPPIGNIDDDLPGGQSIHYDLEPRPQSRRRRSRRIPPPERERVVDVQQARAPRAARPVEGMSLPMVRPPLLDLGLTLESEPFDLPSPREAAVTLEDEPWITWEEAGGYGLAVAEVGGGFIPGVGEAMDIAVLVDTSEPTWARALAVVSLGVSVVTFGIAPNFGGLRRGATRVGRTAVEQGARVAARFCFVAGTLIETPDGRVRIEELMPGDLVYAYEEATGTVVIREVVQTFQRVAPSIVDLTVGDEDGTESTISGTAEHPFFVPAFGEYVDMGELYEGMELLGADGQPLVVVRRDVRVGEVEVFNFEVEEAHNYFVASSASQTASVLVHNECKGVLHSFERHAAQWFGGTVSSSTHLRQWKELLERASRSSVRFAWRTGDADTIAHLATIDGKRLMVQFFTSGPRAGEIATAFVPSQRQMRRIHELLSNR